MERLRFDRFVERRLYDPTSGFYEVGGAAGRRDGDFVTSVEVGPLFGRVVGAWLDDQWRRGGEPEDFVVVEVGAGRGTLARSIRSGQPKCAESLRYVAVERSASLRAAIDVDGVTVTVTDRIPVDSGCDVILANELLDNIPFRMAEFRSGEWRELWVELDEGAARWFLGDTVTSPVLAATAEEGARLPLCDGAAAWVAHARSMVGEGSVLAFDYGVARTSELLGRDWCRTYRAHERGSDALAPGPIDICCDVPFDQLGAPRSLRTQASFLEEWGIATLVEEGREIWTARAGIGDLAAITARSRIREAEALTDPAGLGGFLVAEWAGAAAAAGG